MYQMDQLCGRQRQESDWDSLLESWKNANKDDHRAKFMFYLETEETKLLSGYMILAYAVFHFEKGHRYAEVIFFEWF